MARRKALVEPDAMAAMPTREGAKRSGPSRETQLLGGGGPPALFVRPRKKARRTMTMCMTSDGAFLLFRVRPAGECLGE